MDYIKIGLFLQALRKAKGVTQAELAEYFEVSNKTVSKWECGDSLPEIPLLKALADFYDITVDEILNGGRVIKSENSLEKKKKDNEDYFINKAKKKFDLWMMISVISLAFGYLMLYVLGYTVGRCDIACFVSLSIYFISICLFFIGKYQNISLSDEFELEKLKKYKKHRVVCYLAYFAFMLFATISSIAFYIIPVTETGILNSHINIIDFISYSCIYALVTTLLCLLIYFMIYPPAKIKRIAILDCIWYLTIAILLILLVVQPYGLKQDGGFASDYSFFSFGYHRWTFYVGLIFLVFGIVLSIVFQIKKINQIIPRITTILATIFVMISISSPMCDVVYYYSVFSVLNNLSIVMFIFPICDIIIFIKRRRSLKESSAS